MKIHKKIKIKWIFVATLVLLFVLPLTASAATSTVSSQMSSVFGDVLQGFAQFLAVMLKVLQRILWPVFLAIGGLLNNDILFGYGMEQRLLEVWMQIRNFVNIIFVVALLGVALFNVLAFKPDSEFALKAFLPKFAIALIAVNFSYIGMKIILDVSNVMTYAVFALPSSISEQVSTPEFMNNPNDDKSKKTVDKICKAYYGSTKDFEKLQKDIEKITPDDRQQAIQKSLLCKTSGSTYLLSPAGSDFFKRYNSRNVALIMAIQFMNVTNIDDISTKFGIKDASTKVDISGLTFQLLFSVILYIVYGAAYLAIFVVLLVRLVVLWLFIALSPLIVLKYVLPQSAMPSSAGNISESFFKNTFAPVLMGIPLTIGYIILEAFKGASYSSEKATDLIVKMVQVDNAAISDLQSMIIAFAAVAVVWVGVFAAAEGTFAQAVTDRIKGAVRGIGTKAAKAITFIPLIPAGQGGKGLSLAQAQDVWAAPWKNLEAKYGRGSRKERKLSLNQINKIASSKSSKVEEGRRAIASGLGMGTKKGQQAVYNLLEKWRTRGSAEQKTFAKEAIKRINRQIGDYGKLKTGKVTSANINRLKGISYLTPGAAVAGGASNPVSHRAKPGAAPKTTTAQGKGPAYDDIQTIGRAESLGIVSDDLKKKRQEYRDADTAGRKSIADEFSKSREMADVKKAMGASRELGTVKATVGTLDANSSGAAVQKLKKELEAATKALKKKGVSEDGTKRILGNILKSKFGNDAQKFVDANADVKALVSL